MRNKNYTITEALEFNLHLLVENSKNLARLFRHKPDREEMYHKIYITALVLLNKVYSGDFIDKEHEIYEATLPLCKKMCKDWHKYHQE